jgi:hypothetical protein
MAKYVFTLVPFCLRKARLVRDTSTTKVLLQTKTRFHLKVRLRG